MDLTMENTKPTMLNSGPVRFAEIWMKSEPDEVFTQQQLMRAMAINLNVADVPAENPVTVKEELVDERDPFVPQSISPEVEEIPLVKEEITIEDHKLELKETCSTMEQVLTVPIPVGFHLPTQSMMPVQQLVPHGFPWKTPIDQHTDEPSTKRGKYWNIRSTDDLNDALDRILKDGWSICKASRHYHVPFMTLSGRLEIKKVGIMTNAKMGRPLPLTDEEDIDLANYVKEMQEYGFHLSSTDIRREAYKTTASGKREFAFSASSGMAGWAWWLSFKLRHRLATPPSKSLYGAPATVKQNVVNFYTSLAQALNSSGLADKPERIWNFDQKSFNFTMAVENSGPKMAVFTANASGEAGPLVVIFKGKSFSEMYQQAPPKTMVVESESGYINSEIFLNFLQFFVDNSPEARPIMILMDSHCGYVSPEVLQFQKENGIIFVSFPSYTALLLQPLKVSVFSLMRLAWQSKLSSLACRLSQKNFFALFREVFSETASILNVTQGFTKTGIYPFNPDAITKKDFVVSNVLHEDQKVTSIVNVAEGRLQVSRHFQSMKTESSVSQGSIADTTEDWTHWLSHMTLSPTLMLEQKSDQHCLQLAVTQFLKQNHLKNNTSEERTFHLHHLAQYQQQQLHHSDSPENKAYHIQHMLQYGHGFHRNETPEQKTFRLQRSSQKQQERRKNETPEARAHRLQRMSEYVKRRRQNEMPEERARRLEQMSQYVQRRRQNETSEQREVRLQRMSEYIHKHRQNETPRERAARLHYMSEYMQRYRQNKTLDEKTVHLQCLSEYVQGQCETKMSEDQGLYLQNVLQCEPQHCQNDSQKETVIHLQQKAQTQRQCLQNETLERRARRLQRMSAYEQKRRQNETPEERACRLQRMSQYEQRRRQNETPEEREQRLQRMSRYEQQRRQNETAEERARRLQRMSQYEQQRRQNETPEERENRLQRMSQCERRRRQQNVIPNEITHASRSSEVRAHQLECILQTQQ